MNLCSCIDVSWYILDYFGGAHQKKGRNTFSSNSSSSNSKNCKKCRKRSSIWHVSGNDKSRLKKDEEKRKNTHGGCIVYIYIWACVREWKRGPLGSRGCEGRSSKREWMVTRHEKKEQALREQDKTGIHCE